MLSVIIPAYKASKFIDECLASIEGAEILVGVDRCQETLDHLKHRDDIRLFYFQENVGPFVIKNTLVDEATHSNILFFDSDDILAPSILPKIEQALEDAQYVKLNYIDFHYRIDLNGHKMNNAVIAIRKDVFNSINGFQPWKCGADTEIDKRLQHNGIKCKLLDDVAYFRRLHGNNLTMSKETGYGSPLRRVYMNYVSQHERAKDWPNPPTKMIHSYVTY